MNKELQEIFENFDLNGDGLLSYEELILGYTQMLGCKDNALSQVANIVAKLDAREKIEIDYHEFLKANLKLEHEVTD